MLRILFVCQNDFLGPTEKQALGFAQQLSERGHAVLISVGRDASTVDSEGAERTPLLSVREHRFRRWRLRPEDLAAARSFGPDLIHAFGPRVPAIAAARSYGRATGAPVFVHFEDDQWSPVPRVPGENPLRRAGRVGRRIVAPIHPPAWLHSSRLSLRWTRRHAAGLDALTPALAGEVERRLRRSCAVVLPVSPVLPQDLPTGGTDTLLRPAMEHSAVALFTGSILPIYLPDVMLMLRAVAEARARGCEVILAVLGNVHERVDVTELVRAADLDSSAVLFLDYVPFRRVGALLRAASVLLQPGVPGEFNRLRLPSKLQAYLESGTPTITYAQGPGELLEDRREVLKTYTGTPSELADRIIEAVQDAELRNVLTRGGPAAARRLFDPAGNTAALLAHYEASLL